MPMIQLQSGAVHYDEAGTGSPTLFFVHGFCCSAAVWDQQLAYFRRTNRVVAIDLPGHGRSTDWDDRELGIERFGQDTLDAIEALRLGPCVIVGHSMGCRVALETCRLAPDRFQGIVLLDGRSTSTEAESEIATSLRRWRECDYGEILTDTFMDMFTEDSDPLIRRRVLRDAQGVSPAFARALYPKIVEWDRQHMLVALGSLRIPTLVLQSTGIASTGARASLGPSGTSSWIELVQQNVPSANVEVVARVGHFLMLEAPAQTNALLESFLREAHGV